MGNQFNVDRDKQDKHKELRDVEELRNKEELKMQKIIRMVEE